jgi:hypothetical protein
MTLERRAQALLDIVENDRCAQCESILAEARGRASTLVAQVHADSRTRMREAFAEERRRLQERVSAARAKLQTRQRLHEQQRTAALLALGWQQLPDALRARWHDRDTRRLWVEAVVAMAWRVLPRTQWRIAHDPAWPAVEQQALGARIARDLDMAPAFSADARIDAGLRIASGGNVVDGSLAGLLADRVEVGARLLRYLEQLV